jgi:lipopolysaccharide biosynthesis glycosyltransferase
LPDILLNEKRTIYSDVDVICRSNVREIWEMDLNGKIMAAVRNYEGEKNGQQDDIIRLGFSSKSPYFFTGFLVMDLERMRNEKTAKKWILATTKYGNQVSFIDLDIMNLVCEGDILEVDRVWNETSRYTPLRRDVKIWHFPGALQKPWCNIWKNNTWGIYLKYLLKTPYRSNVWFFVWGHIKGFFFFKYTKKQVTRYLICGIRVWRRKVVR